MEMEEAAASDMTNSSLSYLGCEFAMAWEEDQRR